MCKYKGIDIPCMVRFTENGSITGEILTDILRTIDTLGIYTTERSQGIKPFLLLDGHGSRLSMEFLDYINDEDHEWKVCTGVPYGTALW